MNYYFKKDFFAIQQKITLIEEEFILSRCTAKGKEEEVCRVNYQNISSIQLRADYVGGKQAHYSYSCVIEVVNPSQIITIWCENESYY